MAKTRKKRTLAPKKLPSVRKTASARLSTAGRDTLTTNRLTATPSKPVAVGAAVAHQLHQDGRWPPNDVTRVMETDYHYDEHTLRNLFLGVQAYLAGSVPVYTFSFDQQFVRAGLPLTVAALMAAVNTNTH
jgi:hypothetical protein